MTSTGSTAAAVRVMAPMIQIMSDYRMPKNAPIQRQFAAGDVLPGWVPEDEIARLRALGMVEDVTE